MGLAAVVMLASGCGGSPDSGKKVAAAPNNAPAASSAPPAGPPGGGSTLAYAKCMREKGITNFPDPNAQGKLDLNGNELNSNSAQYKAADDACKPLLPQGGAPPPNAAAVGAAQVKYAKCMRENGVPKFPDPNPDGGIDINGDTLGVDPMGPVFKAADQKCQPILAEVAGGPRIEKRP
ncbi:hypothetical protein [Sphaerisporangium aureirubrum]